MVDFIPPITPNYHNWINQSSNHNWITQSSVNGHNQPSVHNTQSTFVRWSNLILSSWDFHYTTMFVGDTNKSDTWISLLLVWIPNFHGRSHIFCWLNQFVIHVVHSQFCWNPRLRCYPQNTVKNLCSSPHPKWSPKFHDIHLYDHLFCLLIN